MQQKVHPKEIEAELVKIWDDLQGKNKMRACLFNLVIFARKDARRDYLQSVAQRVVKKFPCRIIFITSDTESSTPSLETTVSVMTAEEGDSGIFCDLIQMDLSGSECEKAHFLMLPHILPDLPIYLIWGDDPEHNKELLFKIEDHASKTIFDSESASDLKTFAHSIFEHTQKTESSIIDLNWARTEGWRNLLTSIFYCEDKIELFQSAKSIEMAFNDRTTERFSKIDIQPTYLQAWIACSLGWKFKGHSGDTYTYSHKSGDVKIKLIPQNEENVKPGRVLSINITCQNDESFHFARHKDHPYIVDVRHSTATFCETPGQFLFDKEESGSSFAGEIFHRGTSKHFLKTLKLLTQAP